ESYRAFPPIRAATSALGGAAKDRFSRASDRPSVISCHARRLKRVEHPPARGAARCDWLARIGFAHDVSLAGCFPVRANVHVEATNPANPASSPDLRVNWPDS